MARDFLLTDDGDLAIGANGDATMINDAEGQLIEKLCRLNTGSLKHNIFVGAGLSSLPNGRLDQSKISKIVQQLENDGWTNEDVNIDGMNIHVYANRAI